jgi:hypothetical protein
MRTVFRAADSPYTRGELRWGERTGRWRRIDRDVYGEGPHPPSRLDRQRARILASNGEARGELAGVLHGFDNVRLGDDPRRRRPLSSARLVVIEGVPCADGVQTLIDLAAVLDDDRWEQALESALRKEIATVAELEVMLARLARQRTPGVGRIRRVLGRRPNGVPPTESLLETLALQLSRGVPGLGELTRQRVILDRHGYFVARVDLCHPELGFFLELDGQQHVDQPVYDAARQTAVVAATGWLTGRFTWREITRTPRTSQRRVADLADQCRQRPLIVPRP